MDPMNIIMPFALITSIWGAFIGKKNNLKFWLYNTWGDFGAALTVTIGGFMVTSSDIYYQVAGRLIVLAGSVALYQITKPQFYQGSKFEFWVLYLGKISLSFLTVLIFFIIALMLSKRNEKK